ncbi:hypothetical protein ACFL27_28445, partial [candidate division CSSED10-310 bacterium]
RQIQQKLGEIKEELRSFGPQGQNRPTPLNMLLDLSENIAADITINVQELSLTTDKMDIRGEIDTFKSVELIRSELSKLPYIREVRMGKTTKGVNDEVLVFQTTAYFQDEMEREP